METKLFDLIVDDQPNQDDILRLLRKPEYQKVVNSVKKTDYGEETMLMWAVFFLKNKVVARLLDLGANARFSNEIGSSVSTYWNEGRIEDNLEKACEIAILLHKAGANLEQDCVEYSFSIVKKVRENNIVGMKKTLGKLGYQV